MTAKNLNGNGAKNMAVPTIEILSKVTSIAESTARLEVSVSDLKKTVMGNGKPGLVDRMNIIEGCFGEHSKNQEKAEKAAGEKANKKIDFGTKVLLAIVGMIVSNLGVLLFSLFK